MEVDSVAFSCPRPNCKNPTLQKPKKDAETILNPSSLEISFGSLPGSRAFSSAFPRDSCCTCRETHPSRSANVPAATSPEQSEKLPVIPCSRTTFIAYSLNSFVNVFFGIFPSSERAGFIPHPALF